LTKKELIKQMAIEMNQSVAFVTKFYQTFIDILIKYIKNNKKVTLSPLGTIFLASRDERIIKSIKDQTPMIISARTIGKFKFSKSFKDMIKNIDLKETI